MLNRSLFFLALTLQISFTASNLNAANDLEKWNSEQGRVARSAMKEKINTTTYREMPNHVDSSYRSAENGGKVLRQLETSAEIKGSRVGTTIEALKEVDKHATAKKWAKELGKGGLRFAVGAVLIEAAMQEMLDGIGWTMAEGGKVKKKPDPNSEENAKYSSNYIYHGDGGTAYSLSDYGRSVFAQTVANNSGFSDSVFTSATKHPNYSCNSAGNYNCVVSVNYTRNGASYTQNYTLSIKANPDYKPDYVVEPQPVPQSEMEQKINDYLNDPTKPQNVKDIIIEQAEKPKGKASIMWSDDPSSEQTINQDNKNTANKILNSDDPKGEGLVKDTPKISDGTEGSADTTPKPDPNPNPNPDPDPGTTPTPNPNPNPNPDTGSTTIFNLPPFCDYAAKLCDWLDWTQEKPDEEEQKEEENINNRGIFDRTFDLDFSLGGQCPPNLSWSMNNKYLNKTFEIDLGWACIFFTAIGYAFIFLSNCLGIWIMYETVVRKEIKW